MKLRKILSAVAACAVAASALSVSSFASVFDVSLTEGGNGGPAVYMFPSEETMGIELGDIDSVKFYTVSTTDYFKGIIGGNVNGTWTTTAEKEFDLSSGVTEVKDIPDYENDGNMQFQCWWMNPGSIEFTKVEMLDASGKVLYTDGAAAVEEVKAEPVTEKIAYTDGETASYTYKVGAGVKELKVKVALTGNVEWNDWCGAGVIVTDAKGNKTYYQWGGAQVTWGWDADGDKVDDSIGGAKGSTWLGTIGTDGGEIAIPVSDGATVEFYCLSWDSQPGVDQYTLTFDAPSAEDTKKDEEPAPTQTEEAPVDETSDEASDETYDETSDETSDEISDETSDETSDESFDVSSEEDGNVEDGNVEDGNDDSAWEEAVANASKDIADYLDTEASNKTLFLKYDDGKVGYVDAADIDITKITGVKFNVTFDELEVADEAVWIGGGIGANSNSTGWKQVEWGRNEKPIIADLENGTITWDNGESIFKADDTYAQLWVCSWGGSLTVDSVELLFAEDAASADNSSADNSSADDNKANPDTGVAGVAVAAGVVALAGAAVVVSRKRK